MPLEADPRPFGPLAALPPEPQPSESPSVGETLGAAFRLENTIGSLVSREAPFVFEATRGPRDPDFDPFADMAGYEEFSLAFRDAETPDDVNRIKRQIDRERADLETLDAAGAGGYAASLAGALLDPIFLMPVAGPVARSARAGSDIVRAGLATAGAGAAGASAAEAVLAASQVTRSPATSAVNVAGATLLSALLGGGVAALTRRRFAKLAKRVEKDLEPRDVDPIEPGQVVIDEAMLDGDTSAGAVQADRTTLADEAMKSTFGLAKAIRKTSPMLRTAMSPSVETRTVAQQLIETPFRYEKNSKGIANPISVESRTKMWTANLGEAIEQLDSLFVHYRLGRAATLARGERAAIGGRDILSGGAPGHMMRFNEFKAEIGRAMRRGDQSDIPEVAEAARFMRRKVFEPLKERAIEAKLLPEDVDVETALSYLTRVYDVDRILAERGAFRDTISEWLRGLRTKAQERLETREADLGVAARSAEAKGDPKAMEKVAAKLEQVREEATLAKAEDAELDTMADEIIDSILETPNGRIDYGPITLARGPLKERTFSIDDDLIEPWLLDDIEIISRFYTRTMAPDVELARAFGSPDIDAPLQKVIADYNRKSAAAASDKERIGLSRQREADLRDIVALRDRLRGTYAAPKDPNAPLVRGFRVVRNWNYLRILGGVVINSLPDVMRPVMSEGLWRTFRHGWAPLVTNLKGVRLAGEEAKLAGTAWDMALDTRALSIAELGDDFSRQLKFEKGIQAMASNFSLVNMLAPWNAAMKQFAATVVSSRILEVSRTWARGGISTAAMEKMAASGINREMAVKIAGQFKAHGRVERGVYIANTRAWTDGEAVTAFRAALQKDVDTVIVTPGAGDRPLWMSHELGKIVGQFRSFAFAATQRILIPALQQRDLAVLNGVALSLGMGALVYYLKTINAGREPSDNPNTWIAEAVDRSGMLGWIMDLNGILEKGSRGVVGLNKLTGGPTMSRYAVRNAVGAVLGPTFGFGESAFQVTGAAATGEMKASDLRAIRRLLPYQNLFYLRGLLDKAQAETNEELGNPVRR